MSLRAVFGLFANLTARWLWLLLTLTTVYFVLNASQPTFDLLTHLMLTLTVSMVVLLVLLLDEILTLSGALVGLCGKLKKWALG